MRPFLIYILSAALVIQPLATSYAESGRMQKLSTILNSASDDVVKKLGDYDQLEKALIEKNISMIPKELLNVNLLVGQTLELPNGRVIQLDEPEGEVPPIAYDKLRLRPHENDLLIEFVRGGQVVALQRIPGLETAAVTQDEEMAIAVTATGDIYAFDMGLTIESAGKSPVPAFRVFESIPGAQLPVGAHTKATFRTLGFRPFTLEEVTAYDTNETIAARAQSAAPVIPRDQDGHVLYDDGDLILYNEVDGQRSLVGVFNRSVLYGLIRKGTMTVAVQSMLSSHVGYEDSFGDIKERLLMLEMPLGTKSLLENVVSFLEDEAVRTDVENLQKKIAGSDPLVRAVFQNVSRAGIKSRVARARQIDSNAERFRDNVGQYTIAQSLSAFEHAKEQSQSETGALAQEIEATSGETRKALEAQKARLEHEQQSDNFNSTYRQLLLGAATGESAFVKAQKSWRERFNWKSLRRLAWITSAGGLTAWAATKGVNHFFPTEWTLILNWMNENLVPESLKATYKGMPYWKPALYGAASLMTLAPLIHVMGAASAPVMKWMSERISSLSSVLKDHAPTRAQKIAQALHKYASAFSPLTTWQRVVTTLTRPYAYLVLPIIHWFDKYLVGNLLSPFGIQVPEHRQQSMMAAVKKGLNPFQRVDGSSPIGQAAGLEPTQKMWLANVNPFGDSEALKKQRAQQHSAMSALERQRNRSGVLAWTLATLAISQEHKIDPATLMALQSGQITPDQLEKLHEDKTLIGKWEIVANSLRAQLLDMATKGEVSLDNLDEDTYAQLFNEAKALASKIKSSGRIKNSLRKLKLRFSTMGYDALKGLGRFGTEEFQFLKQVTASPFVAQQTAQSFIYDHAIVVAFPALWGERADFNNPAALAHDPDKFLWTTQQHFNDVFSNLMSHLLMAGPRKALMYQKVRAVQETNYDRIERTILAVGARPEKFIPGAIAWFASLVKRAPDLNFGAYYIYDFLRRVKTVQAVLLLTFATRLAITDQSVFQIWMGYWLAFFASTLAYAWPWNILERGNQFEEERLEARKAQVQSAVENIAVFTRQGRTDEVRKSYQELADLYASGNTPGLNEMLGSLKSFEKIVDIVKSESIQKSAIAEALRDKERRVPIVATLSRLHTALEKQDLETAHEAWGQLVAALNININSPEFAALQKAIEPQLSALVDLNIDSPAIYTAANSATSNLTTLGLGAILTTAMAVSLLVDTFTPEKLNIENIASWAGMTGVFYAAMFTLFSKYMWLNHYIPFWKNRLPALLEKTGVRKGPGSDSGSKSKPNAASETKQAESCKDQFKKTG